MIDIIFAVTIFTLILIWLHARRSDVRFDYNNYGITWSSNDSKITHSWEQIEAMKEEYKK